MGNLRVLVVEDAINWQDALIRILQRLGENVLIDVAPNYDRAIHYVSNEQYDLVSVDLSLLDDQELHGMKLLRELRHNRNNRGCGLLVLTGYPATDLNRKVFRDYHAYDFVDKASFDVEYFLKSASAAIFDARLRQAIEKANIRSHLTISFNRDQLTGSLLTGPNRHSGYAAEFPVHFDLEDLVRRGDYLSSIVFRKSTEAWHAEALSTSDAIFDVLARDKRILGDLAAAQELVQPSDNLALQFRGPTIGLGAPFELLRDRDIWLGLNHILTRQVIQNENIVSRKLEPFHMLLADLVNRQETLRILVVDAISGSGIPRVEMEVHTLAEAIKDDLHYVGIPCDITLLTGSEATYQRVMDALLHQRFHILHYSGHIHHDEALPDAGGLILPHGKNQRTVTAAKLNLLVQGTELRLVFLACCMGSQTNEHAKNGHFYDGMDALVHADIPIILGYRWNVKDEISNQLVYAFYRELWRTLLPCEALMLTRRFIASIQGQEEPAWAAPILLMQNT